MEGIQRTSDNRAQSGGSAGVGPGSSSAAGAARGAAPSGVFVDAVTGRHASTSAAELLAKRRFTWSKHYGWTYDAWVDDPAQYALAGANGRFSLPALARGFSATVSQATGSAAAWLQQHQTTLLAPLQQLTGAGAGMQRHGGEVQGSGAERER